MKYINLWLIAVVTLGLTKHVSAQTKSMIEPSGSVLVESSTEIIREPYPTRDELPKTVSLDALTEQEIQAIRVDVFRDPKKPDCLAWIFKRLSVKQAWQPIGFNAWGQRGHGAIKINGHLRPFQISLTLYPDRGYNTPTDGGGAWDMSSVSGYAELISNSEKKSKNIQNFLSSDPGKLWHIDFDNAQLRIEKKSSKCTLMDTKCRTYVSKTKGLNWKSKSQSNDWMLLSISASEGLEIAIEDMCPWDRGGLIEYDFKSRIGGPSSGIFWHGIRSNTPLLKALEPYVISQPAAKKP
jgi:hypothetical protein